MSTNPDQAVLTGNDELGLKKKTVFSFNLSKFFL